MGEKTDVRMTEGIDSDKLLNMLKQAEANGEKPTAWRVSPKFHNLMQQNLNYVVADHLPHVPIEKRGKSFLFGLEVIEDPKTPHDCTLE